jgi:hypothetical protein
VPMRWLDPGKLALLRCRMNRLRRIADEAGRDVSVFSVTLVRGEPDRAKLDAYEKAGLTRVLLTLPSADRDTGLRQQDDYAPLLG